FASSRALDHLDLHSFPTRRSSDLPYFYSLFLLNHISMETIPSTLLIIGYNIIMVLPSLLLLGVNKLFKKKVQKALNKIRSKLKEDRKSTRLNSSHVKISYAVFCLK